MDRSRTDFSAAMIALLMAAACASSAEPVADTTDQVLTPRNEAHYSNAKPAPDTTHTISGTVSEVSSGTSDVPVCLFSAATGMPLTKGTYKPIDWGKAHEDGTPIEMAIAVTDSKGRFRFENVPDGKYRLMAQKWTGPYKGAFEVHGTVIQLLGSADNVVVPRPSKIDQAQVASKPPRKGYYNRIDQEQLALRPLGKAIVQFDQEVGNDETFMFLSLSPPEFDPVLGFNAMGPSFFQHMIGVNRMPRGKTTVIGAPDRPLYAFFFAADDSPGFAALEVPASRSGLIRMGPEPYIAGWSDGRKTPPPKLGDLMKFMEAHSLTVQQVLDIPELSNATFEDYRDRMAELSQDLSREVELPEGRLARVGDLLAVDGYRRLQKR